VFTDKSQRTPSLLKTDAPSAPPAPPPLETVQGNLQAGRATAEEPERAAALAHIRSALPVYEAGLPVHEDWLASPVVPTREGEDFPAYENVPALLRVANAQDVADLEIPSTLSAPFLTVRKTVNGYVAAIPRAKAAKAEFPTITPGDFERPPTWQGTPFWPELGRVSHLRAALQAMGVGRDSLDDAARYLAQTLEAVLRTSRAKKAAGVRQAVLTMSRQQDAAPLPSITHFDPRARTR